jgi:hypothetical protein
MLLQDRYAPERRVLEDWASGFVDRDGKFVQEFQTTFESGLWELYLNACLRAWGMHVDMSHSSPDFVISRPAQFCMEAGIASPPQGGKAPMGFGVKDIPENFGEFNVEATLRITNTFTSKVSRYREYYRGLAHVVDKPFVIAIAAFDRPFAHFAASRPALAALYGIYYDEDATPPDATRVTSYPVHAALKASGSEVPVGLFCDSSYPEVSAVVYSALATWGKVRALADNPGANTVYTAFRPSRSSLLPEISTAKKADYTEDLLDGMYIFHNPFASRPLPSKLLSHSRIAELMLDSNRALQMTAPDDFLLVRTLMSFTERA